MDVLLTLGHEAIPGLSWRQGVGFLHNPDRPVSGLAGGEIRLPDRGARVLRGYTLLGRQVDVVETSRGCAFECSFCSIIDFRERGLVINERLEESDGTTAVVRSKRLAAEEIEFLRWQAERWMKVRHMAAVLRHSPVFVLQNARRMLAHTFRGSSIWRAFLGLEDERKAFARYRAIRRAEREYLPG